jgi:hypothetical protein
VAMIELKNADFGYFGSINVKTPLKPAQKRILRLEFEGFYPYFKPYFYRLTR